jgi:hypothetical protein
MRKTWQNISNIISKSNRQNYFNQEFVINGKLCKNLNIIAHKFNEFFVNVGPDLAKKITARKTKNFRQYMKQTFLCRFDFKLIYENDTLKAIKSLNMKNSYGIDGISTTLLSQISPCILRPLTLIINQSLASGIFPEYLKIAKVFPLHKKGPTNVIDNFRPISLLTSISKVFEKIVFTQLYAYLIENNIIHDSQYGFRKQHSAEHATMELSDILLNNLDKKGTPMSIHLDLSKAFDTLDHDILLQKLNLYGIQATSLSWFRSYLTNRKQFVDINQHSSTPLLISTGVPQGSILGPLLFILYINDIVYSSDFFQFIMYADDTTLICNKTPTHSTYETFIQRVNKELNNIFIWLCVNKLSLNVLKTKYMVYRNKNKPTQIGDIEVEINNIVIDRVSQFNFLGVILDESLTWIPHINKISLKISRNIGVINSIKRFVPVYVLRTLYFSLVQSHLIYGICSWGFELQRLTKLQKKAVRIINNSKYNAHTEPLFKNSQILKLTDLFNVSLLSFYYKHTKGNLPKYFLSFFSTQNAPTHRYPRRITYVLPNTNTRTKAAEKCIRHYLPEVINTLPELILSKIDTHSFQGFVDYVKRYFLDKYSESCYITNCYICSS